MSRYVWGHRLQHSRGAFARARRDCAAWQNSHRQGDLLRRRTEPSDETPPCGTVQDDLAAESLALRILRQAAQDGDLLWLTSDAAALFADLAGVDPAALAEHARSRA